VVATIQIGQAVGEPAQRVVEDGHGLARLRHAQAHAHVFDAADTLLYMVRGAAQEDRARHALRRHQRAQARVLFVDAAGLRALAVDVAVYHRVPPFGQVAQDLVAHTRHVQGQAARLDQQRAVATHPQGVDGGGHQPQHAARALKALQRRPIVVQTVEDFRVNGVSGAQALQVLRLRAQAGEIGGVAAVQPRVGQAGLLPGRLSSARPRPAPALPSSRCPRPSA
jgi:hypothetical protein